MAHPTVLFTAMAGMAFGSWYAGLLVDLFGSYQPAFASGVVFNLANLIVVLFLLGHPLRRRGASLAVVARWILLARRWSAPRPRL